MNAPDHQVLMRALKDNVAEAPIPHEAPPLSGPLKDAHHIGQSIPRPNIERLTEGRGQFIDDMELPRMAHIVYWRSPVAHARIVKIEREAARSMPGVLAVLDGHDMAQVCQPWVGTLTHLAGIKSAPPIPYGCAQSFLARRTRSGSSG